MRWRLPRANVDLAPPCSSAAELKWIQSPHIHEQPGSFCTSVLKTSDFDRQPAEEAR